MGSLVDDEGKTEEPAGRRDWISVAYFGAAALFCLYELVNWNTQVSFLTVAPLFYYFLLSAFFLLFTWLVIVANESLVFFRDVRVGPLRIKRAMGLVYDLIGVIFLSGVVRIVFAVFMLFFCFICYSSIDSSERQNFFGAMAYLVLLATLCRSLVSSFPLKKMKLGIRRVVLLWTERLSYEEAVPAVFIVYSLVFSSWMIGSILNHLEAITPAMSNILVLTLSSIMYFCLAGFYYYGGPKKSYLKLLYLHVGFDDLI